MAAALCEHSAAGHLKRAAPESRRAAVEEAKSASEPAELVRDPPAVVPESRRRSGEAGLALALLGGKSREGVWSPP